MRGVINPQGYGQQTFATQWMLSKVAGARGGRRSAAKRRRKKAGAKAVRAKPARRKRTKAKRLVKGSAAAKRYMASIRRKRKR